MIIMIILVVVIIIIIVTVIVVIIMIMIMIILLIILIISLVISKGGSEIPEALLIFISACPLKAQISQGLGPIRPDRT